MIGGVHVLAAAVNAHLVLLRVGDGGGDLAGCAGDDGQDLPVPAALKLIDIPGQQLADVLDPGPGASVGGEVEAATGGGIIDGRAPRQTSHRNPGGGGGIRVVVHGHDAEDPTARRRKPGAAVPHLQLHYGTDIEGVGSLGNIVVRIVRCICGRAIVVYCSATELNLVGALLTELSVPGICS